MTYCLKRVVLGLVVLSAIVQIGCNSNPVQPIERATDTDTTANGGNGTDSTDIDIGVAACRQFLDFADTCGATADYRQEAESFCHQFDAVFIDSFTVAMMSCMSGMTCDELSDLIAAADAGVGLADGGMTADTATNNLLQTCMLTAMLTADPQPANENFRQHYCDWAMQCDAGLSLAACQTSFLLSDMAIYMVIDDPYITDADSCVNPMPRCDGTVVTDCLQSVGEDVGVALGL